MSKPRPPLTRHSTSVISTQMAVVIAFAAFAAGVGASWLIFQPSKQAVQQPAPAMVQPETSNADPIPPEVSQMSPAQAAVTLGNWNYDRKFWPKAIESYQRAIALGMDNADVRTDLGNSLRFSGQPQQALQQYQIARRQNPQHENSLCNLATLYASVLNDPGNAVLTWQEYLRRFPNGEKATIARQYVEKASLNLP